jgi:uncharacterized protein YdeI (YjbR/CyaY-like superfamily)
VEPIYFETPEKFRAWLKRNHAKSTELWVGFHKKGSGLPSMTWPESVDEALCFGWIDGIRKSVDETSYTIRFTPRKPTSHWSNVNIARVAVLRAEGRTTEAGLRAFEARTEARSGQSSFEQRVETLDPESERLFRENAAAWAHYTSQPPSYRRQVNWWIVSAKKPETREKRLRRLVDACAAGIPLAQFVRSR